MLAGRVIRTLVAVALTSLAVAACGGSDEEEPSQTTTEAAPERGQTRDGDGAREAPGDGSGGVALEEIGRFDQPVHIADGGDALYVVEQCGRIQRLGEDGPSVFLDISDRVTCGGEQGLLSIAFDPEDRKRFYVYFTDTEGLARTVAFRRDADDPTVADPGSARELLAIEDFAPNHNGGLLLFGPDGRLYAGTGDGGGAGDPERTAQDPDSLLGKLLTIDTETGRATIEALGLRNPWRFSFDPATGDLWIGDVGQDAFEEVNRLAMRDLEAAEPANFGWSAYEGTQRFNADQRAPGAIDPVHTYGREGGCSITGGYVVRDSELASLEGRYLYGDYCAGQLRSFPVEPRADPGDDRELGLEVPSLSSFGTDREGNIYAVSLDGPVYRLVPQGERNS